MDSGSAAICCHRSPLGHNSVLLACHLSVFLLSLMRRWGNIPRFTDCVERSIHPLSFRWLGLPGVFMPFALRPPFVGCYPCPVDHAWWNKGSFLMLFCATCKHVPLPPLPLASLDNENSRGVYSSLFAYIHIELPFLADFIKKNKLGPFYKRKKTIHRYL